LFVRIVSWHVVAMTYRSGDVKTRCGRRVKVVGSLSTTPGPTRPTSEDLPLDESSCESCLRLIAHDRGGGDEP
jgi:hypothetical protein